jgi:hypothetical protein
MDENANDGVPLRREYALVTLETGVSWESER